PVETRSRPNTCSPGSNGKVLDMRPHNQTITPTEPQRTPTDAVAKRDDPLEAAAKLLFNAKLNLIAGQPITEDMLEALQMLTSHVRRLLGAQEQQKEILRWYHTMFKKFAEITVSQNVHVLIPYFVETDRMLQGKSWK